MIQLNCYLLQKQHFPPSYFNTGKKNNTLVNESVKTGKGKCGQYLIYDVHLGSDCIA